MMGRGDSDWNDFDWSSGSPSVNLLTRALHFWPGAALIRITSLSIATENQLQI